MTATTTYTLHYRAGVWECSRPFRSLWELENYLYEWFTKEPDEWDNPPMFTIEQVSEMFVTVYNHQEVAA